jgi:hypothetical protein
MEGFAEWEEFAVFGKTVGGAACVFEAGDGFDDDIGHAGRLGDLGEFGELQARERGSDESAGEGGWREGQAGGTVAGEAAEGDDHVGAEDEAGAGEFVLVVADEGGGGDYDAEGGFTISDGLGEGVESEGGFAGAGGTSD